jgi:hypothetical protein
MLDGSLHAHAGVWGGPSGCLRSAGLSHEKEFSADVVRTKKLVIVNDADQPRAVLSSTADGNTGLVLLDETGKQRAELIHTVDQKSAVQFFASDGTPRAILHSTDNGENTLVLHDRHGNPRIHLVISPNDDALLLIMDRNQALRIALAANSNYAASISVGDDTGKPRATIKLVPMGDTSFIIVDEKENVLAQIP